VAVLLGFDAPGQRTAPSSSPDDLAGRMQAFLQPRAAAASRVQVLEVLVANDVAVALFALMRTQWRWARDERQGLDYGALPAALWGLGRGLTATQRADAMARLQVMEAHALMLWAGKAS